tara:strand:- start:959 stop:1396 length:438 start_codon:yes stop_codon:yes gene_type:complete
MSINYQNILNQNLVNVLKDILKHINKNGLSNSNHLYVTFITKHNSVQIPNWLIKKYPNEMTIVIQYEYYDLKIFNDFFEIKLSFNDKIINLKIGYRSIISFTDPSVNFGFRLRTYNAKDIEKSNIKDDNKNKSNVVEFSKFKKLT